MIKEKLADYDPSDVINMDQSPIPYSYNLSKTLEVKGKKTIHVNSSTVDTKRVTLAVKIDTSRKMLLPMLIFKGATNGHITTCEFGTYLDGSHYCCQKKHGWMRK